MSIQLKLRRGTTEEHNTFVGGVGELTVDTSRKILVLHDGVTPGGLPQIVALNQANETLLGGIKAKIKTEENGEVAIDPLTGKLYAPSIAGGVSANGLPVGGTTGQILKKVDNTNFNAAWESVYNSEPINCQLKKSQGQSIPMGIFTDITFDVEQSDINGMHNLTNPARITIPANMGGLYMLIGKYQVESGANHGTIANFRKNDIDLPDSWGRLSGIDTPYSMQIIHIINLVPGDYVTFQAYVYIASTIEYQRTSFQVIKM